MKFYPISSLVWQQPLFPSEPASSSIIMSRDERLATAIGNIAGILFAFATNDTIVFKQERKGWFQRLIRLRLRALGPLYWTWP